MTATIAANNGAGITTPMLVLSPYAAENLSRNVVHDTLDGDIAVSLVPPRPRSGELALLYPDAATAEACRVLHLIPTSFTLTETETPVVGMTYVLAEGGRIRVELDPETLTMWIVRVPFQERLVL